jgi:NAD(P)-dependent dehydrogenase (short-subunit alcohol dehydrogenase family)
VVAEANVADAEQLRGLFDLAEKHFGGLDIVVTNATAWRFSPIAEATDETPLRRIGEPEDIADVVAFLVSDDARRITGQSSGAGGGMF